MNFTINYPKTPVAPLAIIRDSNTYLSQPDALWEKWKSPGGLGIQSLQNLDSKVLEGIQSLQNLDSKVFERYFKIKMFLLVS